MHQTGSIDPFLSRQIRWARTIGSGLVLSLLVLLMGCTDQSTKNIANQENPASPETLDTEIYVARYDDLVSAGLGLDGLRAPQPVAPASSAESPTPEDLRTLAFYTHFNGLSAAKIPKGLGSFHDMGLPTVAGREVSTWRSVEGTSHKARVLLQIPDGFLAQSPCLVVAPASGSRGVYGAAPLVAPWALPKGCAVVYTDKGAGTDYFDLASNTGVDLRGQRRPVNSAELGFQPAVDQTSERGNSSLVATAHAHSQSNVEAYWGLYTLEAARWAQSYLRQNHGVEPGRPITTMAAGLSNGGQAVLRALEADENSLLDAVVAVMPNITPPAIPSLYTYASVAALAQPCLLGDAEFASALPFANPLLIGFGAIRCQSLHDAGLIDAPSPEAARAWLGSVGFDDDSLTFSASIVVLDVWRTVLANYASAYMKTAYDQMPCGYALDAQKATPLEKAQWWATGSGSPPHTGITLIDSQASVHPQDPHFAGLLCLYNLKDEPTLKASVEKIRARAQWSSTVPVFITHGQLDALIPANLSSRPYVAQAKEAGMAVTYQEIEGAQHFDAFLNLLPTDQGWTPILPYGWEAMDKAWEALGASDQ